MWVSEVEQQDGSKYNTNLFGRWSSNCSYHRTYKQSILHRKNLYSYCTKEGYYNLLPRQYQDTNNLDFCARNTSSLPL